MTEEINKRIKLSEYPKAMMLLQFIEGLFKKNTELFQFAFGTILFSNAINILIRSEGGLTNNTKSSLWILLIFFVLYVSFIILKYLRDYLENRNLLFSQTVKQYDLFLTTHREWIHKKAEVMAVDNYDEAIAFLQKGISLFNVTSIAQIDEKLTRMFMLVNDTYFQTNAKFKPRAPNIDIQAK